MQEGFGPVANQFIAFVFHPFSNRSIVASMYIDQMVNHCDPDPQQEDILYDDVIDWHMLLAEVSLLGLTSDPRPR